MLSQSKIRVWTKIRNELYIAGYLFASVGDNTMLAVQLDGVDNGITTEEPSGALYKQRRPEDKAQLPVSK